MKKRIAFILALCLIMVCCLPTRAYAATIRQGSRGTEVRYLQMNLNGLGYAVGTADGIAGSKTVAGIKAFQRDYGLTVDGIAGTATQTKLTQLIKNIQTNLNTLGYSCGTADGIYGSQATTAVKNFQRNYGLSVSGIAYPETQNKLNAAISGKYDPNMPSQVITYSKSQSGEVKLSDNFKVREFACQDGSDTILIDSKLVALLQDIRDHFGKPITINSAYRTPSHNAAVGGASSSQHLKGTAADIVVQGVSPIEVARYAESIGVKGIGLYSWGVHVDTRTTQYFWKNSGSNGVSTFG